jgi:Mg2+ and Co2+ transporter CorA
MENSDDAQASLSVDISLEIRLAADIKDVLDELDALAAIFKMQTEISKPLSSLLGIEIVPVHQQHIRGNPYVVPWDISDMKGWAEQTYTSLQDLLDLKQKQTSIIEARLARKDSEVSAKQGYTIMVFTFITGIFLPLSFLTSIFGLNTPELNRGSLHIGVVLGIICMSIFSSTQYWLTHSLFATND